jgi:hypothetical protein
MNNLVQNWVPRHFKRTFNLIDEMKSILNMHIPVTRRKIVEFGVVFFAVLAVILPLFVVWRNDWSWIAWLDWSVAAGIAMMALCLSTGMMMAPIYKLWMRLALVLGTIMTAVIITIVFYVLITPIGLARRILRSKSDYVQSFDRQADSYWVQRSDGHDSRRMEKMY